MAANALASIAAATAAGYKLERTLLPGGQNFTKLSKLMTGQEGQSGRFIEWPGDSSVSSGAADTAALANLNAWRNDRYGTDSTAVSTSATPTASASPSSQGVAPTHRAMAKDAH